MQEASNSATGRNLKDSSAQQTEVKQQIHKISMLEIHCNLIAICSITGI